MSAARVALIVVLATQYRVGCDCAGPESPGADAGSLDAGVDAGAVPGVHAVAGADAHGCRIVSGQLSCWGAAETGALGIGDAGPRELPTLVAAEVPFISVAAGSNSTSAATCALDGRGDVWCWGSNDHGQLGQGVVGESRGTPAKVPLAVKARSLAQAHFETFCAIGVDGSLWCWGSNREGQLTLGDGGLPPSMPAPVRVDRFSDWSAVSAGQGHTCALRSNGEAWCWGRNTTDILGAGPGLVDQLREPQRVASDAGFTILSAGQSHTCAIADGRLLCWGSLFFYGDGTKSVPFDLDAGSAWVDVSVNTFHGCAIDSRRELYCWGRNAEGQLCLGDNADRQRPTRVPGADWVTVTAFRFSTCAQTSDGGTFCCGQNDQLCLGIGTAPSRTNTLVQQP